MSRSESSDAAGPNPDAACSLDVPEAVLDQLLTVAIQDADPVPVKARIALREAKPR